MTEATAGAAPDFDQLPELDQTVEARLRPEITPRSAWGDGYPPLGPLDREDDVRFLIVHHTASRNDYGPDEVIAEIRDFYEFHVGPERGWLDLAYNFVVDRFGGIWEARQGSLAGPVRGDATGGSQGFALLASLIGNHVEEPPTAEALDSLTRLLAWMAHRHRIDTSTDAEVTFMSQGSSRWPVGAVVTARTISGHRDMSDTTCPGDPVYGLLDRSMPADVQRLRDEALIEARAELGIEPPPPAGDPDSGSKSDTDTDSATISSQAVEIGTDGTESAASPIGGDDDAGRYLISAGATMVIGGLAGLIALRRRRLEH